MVNSFGNDISAGMSGWAVKFQRRAAHLGSAVASCTHAPAPYPCRMEKYYINGFNLVIISVSVC